MSLANVRNRRSARRRSRVAATARYCRLANCQKSRAVTAGRYGKLVAVVVAEFPVLATAASASAYAPRGVDKYTSWGFAALAPSQGLLEQPLVRTGRASRSAQSADAADSESDRAASASASATNLA